MDIDELLRQIESGECSEMFECGTAAIVSPIAALADARDEREYRPRDVDVFAPQWRSQLLAIQERRAPDLFGWTWAYAPLPRLPRLK